MEPGVSGGGASVHRRRRRSWTDEPPVQRLWTINILLVEDDPADTSLILDVLRRHPSVASTQASDEAGAALRQLKAGALKPDLVLLDIRMPRMDGFAFLEAIRAIPSMRDTPVVFLTTSGLSRDVVEAKHSSALGYVVKPDTLAELQKRLDAVIRHVTMSR